MVVGRLFRKHRTTQEEEHHCLRVDAQQSRENTQGLMHVLRRTLPRHGDAQELQMAQYNAPRKKQLSMGMAPRRCGAQLACAWHIPRCTLPRWHSDARTDVLTHARAHRDARTHVCSHALVFSSGGHGSLRVCTPSGPRCEACGTGGVWKKSHLGSWRRGPGAVRHPRLADNRLADRSRMIHCMLLTNHCLQSKSGSRNSPWPPTAAPRPGRSYCRRGPVLRKKCE